MDEIRLKNNGKTHNPHLNYSNKNKLKMIKIQETDQKREFFVLIFCFNNEIYIAQW